MKHMTFDTSGKRMGFWLLLAALAILGIVMARPLSALADDEVCVEQHMDLIQCGDFPAADSTANLEAFSVDADGQMQCQSSDTIENAIYQGIYDYQGYIDIDRFNVSFQDAMSITRNVVNNSPELFYAGNYVGARGRSYDHASYVYVRYTVSSRAELESQRAAFNQAAMPALATIAAQSSTVDKIHAAHDYLVMNNTYDDSLSKFNAYNALVEQTSVCQGYALALEYLLKASGVSATMVTSDHLNHAWDLVNVDGSWYHVDATFDDSGSDDSEPYHTYFMKSSECIINLDKTESGIVDTSGKTVTRSDWTATAGNFSADNTRYDSYCASIHNKYNHTDKWESDICTACKALPKLVSATVSNSPQTNYIAGDTFSASGARLKVRYSNGATFTTSNVAAVTGTLSGGQTSAQMKVVSGPPAHASTLTFAVPITVRAINRLAGDNALDTMVHITSTGNASSYGNVFTDKGGAVVLATKDGYWDALTAAGIAGLADAPVLLTDGTALSLQTKAELLRLKPRTVVVCGGTSAISESVANAAKSAAGATECYRCAGRTATGTACEIFRQAQTATGSSFSKTAIVATNDGYWDALSIAPYAYAKHCPIFLSEGNSRLSDETLATMKDGGITSVYIVGGTAAVSTAVESQIRAAGMQITNRLAGDNAIQTSEKIAEFEKSSGMQTDKVAVATSGGYWDALCGAALCGRNNSILVLASDGDRTTIDNFIRSNRSSIKTTYVFGGEAAVSYATWHHLADTFRW